MVKVCIIGAGSLGYTRETIKDLFCVEEFRNTIEISFFDINQKNLESVFKIIERDIRGNGWTNKITATTNRREALKDAKYICNFTRIGGVEAFWHDINIPFKYHIDQAVGDTICAGGIMYGQRGIAVMLDICKDIREVGAKDPLFLNVGNPNAMLTWAINHHGGVRAIGLCHGVKHSQELIAKVLGIDEKQLDYVCAGINHQTWFIHLSHNGKIIDNKQLLHALENHPKYSVEEKCRIDMLRRFGYFSTESNGHLSEYLPWYRKRPDDILNWVDPRFWENGESGGYLRATIEQSQTFQSEFDRVWAEGPRQIKLESMTNEHCVHIIRGLETGHLYRGHFNVVNNGSITNLPDDAIVEVPCYVDRNGINVLKIGDLPLGCAAVCAASISVQRLAVEAAVHGNDMLLRQAMMMDPLTGAVCNPPEIWQMTDELLVAQEKWLPQYKDAIAKAKARLSKGPLIPTDGNFKGSAHRQA